MSDFAKKAAQDKMRQNELERRQREHAEAEKKKFEDRFLQYFAAVKEHTDKEVASWNEECQNKDNSELIDLHGSTREIFIEKSRKRIRLHVFLDANAARITYNLTRMQSENLTSGALAFQVHDGTLKVKEDPEGTVFFEPLGCARLLARIVFQS